VEVDRLLSRGAHVVRCMSAPSVHEVLNDEPAGPCVLNPRSVAATRNTAESLRL
jgi:hypothetical protein